MKSKLLPRLMTALALPAIAILPKQAAATSDEGAALEEVVVTARKREERLQDTPISVFVLTAQAIDDRQIRSLEQITGSAPNVTFSESAGLTGSSSAAAVFIRGIGQADFVINTDPGVGIYVDGVYLSKSLGSVLDVFDVERMEVLRGPQGTLFGRNTIGGAINVVSRKPGATAQGYVEGSIGSTASEPLVGIRAGADIPLGSRVLTSVALKSEQQQGWLDNPITGADLGDRHRLAGRVQLRLLPTEHITIDVAADGTRVRENGAAYAAIVVDGSRPNALPGIHNAFIVGGPCVPLPGSVNDPRCYNSQFARPISTNETLAGVRPRSDVDTWGINATVAWELGEVTLKSITAYRDVDAKFGKDQDGTPIDLASYFSHQVQRQFSQELQVSGTGFADRLKYLFGAFYFEESGNEDMDVNFEPIGIKSGGAIDNDNLAVFGQATLDLAAGFSLTAGLRYTEETKRYTPNQFVRYDIGIFGIPPGTLVQPRTQASLDISETTPLATLSYRWSPDVMSYATYSEGFRTGGFTQRVFPPRPDIPSFGPEFVKSYEIGTKAELFDQRLRVNADVFYTDYTDIQVTIFDGIAPTTRNAGTARIRGAELEVAAKPLPALLLEAGVGYLDGEYTSLSAAAQGITPNSRLTNAPRWSGNVALDYTAPQQSFGTFGARLDASLRSTNYVDAVNTPELVQDSVVLLNALVRLTPRSDAFDASLGVTNLLNERYVTSGFDDRAFQGQVEAVFGAPRTVRLTVKAKF